MDLCHDFFSGEMFPKRKGKVLEGEKKRQDTSGSEGERQILNQDKECNVFKGSL